MSGNKPVGNNASSFQIPKAAADEHARGQTTETKGTTPSGAKDGFKEPAADGKKWPDGGGSKDAFTSSEHGRHTVRGHKGHKHAHGASHKQMEQADRAADGYGKKSASSGSAAPVKAGGSLDTGSNVGVVTQGKSASPIVLDVPSSTVKQVSSTPSSATTPAPSAGTAKAATSTPAPAAPAASSAKTTTAASGAAIGGAANSNGTPFDGSTGPIGAATAGPNDPTITVKNNSTTPRYYKIEGSAGSDPEKLNNNTFVLQPGQTATINPGRAFIGAITDQGSKPSAPGAANDGTRQEVMFGQAGKTWYDADLEYVASSGAPNSTLGPTDTSLKADDGRNSLVGNQDAYLYPTDDTKNRVVSTQKMTITSSDGTTPKP